MKSGVPGHIGIVAPTVEGAALCYREIALQAAARLGPERHPEMSLHSFQLADYCDAVVLGCTEIPLLIGEADSSLPILDSTRILAAAALERALAG